MVDYFSRKVCVITIAVTTTHPGHVDTAIFAATGSVPEDAIPVDQAVCTILQAISRKDAIVVLPEQVRLWAEQLRQDPSYYDQVMISMARERRHNYQTKGNYF